MILIVDEAIIHTVVEMAAGGEVAPDFLMQLVALISFLASIWW